MAQEAPPQLFQGVAKSSFGYKLLASLGWQEGQGLVGRMERSCCAISLATHGLCTAPPSQGANKQGITEHVKVKKKHDALGVGAVSFVYRPTI